MAYRVGALARHGCLRGGHRPLQQLAPRAGALGALAPKARFTCFELFFVGGGEPGGATSGENSELQLKLVFPLF